MKTISTAFALVVTLGLALVPSTAVAQPAGDAGPHDLMAVNAPPSLARPTITVTPDLDRAVALGIQKKNANHALVLRDAGQGFANAMAAMSAPRWQQPATKSGLWLEVYVGEPGLERGWLPATSLTLDSSGDGLPVAK